MADQLGEGTHLGRRTKRVILFRHLRGRARDEALDDSVVQSRAARKRVGRLRVCCAAYSKSEKAEKDRKSTRLNSSHVSISYAVFCLKKKKQQIVSVYPAA